MLMLTISSTRWSFRSSLFVMCIVSLCAFIRVLISYSFCTSICDFSVHNGIHFFLHRSPCDNDDRAIHCMFAEHIVRISKNCEQHMDAGYKLHCSMLKHQFFLTRFNWLTKIFHSFRIFCFLLSVSLLPHPPTQHNRSALTVAMWTMVFFRFPCFANVDAVAVLTQQSIGNAEGKNCELFICHYIVDFFLFFFISQFALLLFYSFLIFCLALKHLPVACNIRHK